MTGIVMEGVHYAYPGQARGEAALRHLSLTVEHGIVGIVGPNGSGKTTLFRVILGALAPLAGRVLVGGEPPDRYRREHGVGFIPETPAFDEYLTVREFLNGLGRLNGSGDLAAVDPQLEGLWDRRLGSLSMGQMRRVEIAAAFLGDPDLVLLDEPTNGLDPVAVGALRGMIADKRRAGRSIIVASHHLDELQRTVDQLLILDGGEFRGAWPREEVLSEHGSFDALFHSLFAAEAGERSVLGE
jgi:ABC-type multidrug transport system ATPase subunit